MTKITTVILAAGKSTRFKGPQNKLLHNLAGLPVISHVVNVAKNISGKEVIIVCNKNNIKDLRLLLNDCKFVIQRKQNGTADAINVARPFIKNKYLLVLFVC